MFRFEIGVAAILGAMLEAPRGARLRTAACRESCSRWSPLVPFYLAAPHAMYHDTIGFYAIQDLQRLPFPIGFSGPLRPSKLIEFYIPLILVVSLALWALAMAVAIATRGRSAHATAALRGGIVARARARAPEAGAWSLAPLALVGLGYLLGRTDEFHLVPLAAVLPVMLAWAAAAARQLPMRIALLAGVAADRRLRRRAPRRAGAAPAGAGGGPGSGRRRRQDRPRRCPFAGRARGGDRRHHPPRRADPGRSHRDWTGCSAGDPLLYIILAIPTPPATTSCSRAW